MVERLAEGLGAPVEVLLRAAGLPVSPVYVEPTGRKLPASQLEWSAYAEKT